MKVNQALRILKPIVLGLESGAPIMIEGPTDDARAQSPFQSSEATVATGGAVMQAPPQPPRAMRQAGGFVMQPPQPPQGTRSWNWATRSWQWTWQ